MQIPIIRAVLAILATLGVVGAVSSGVSPAPGINPTVLLKRDSNIPGHEGTMAIVEIAPGAAEGLHTHPADLYGFVLEGSPSIERAGSPTITLQAGEAFFTPAGVVHQSLNNTKAPARILVVLVAPKDKPLRTPAP